MCVESIGSCKEIQPYATNCDDRWNSHILTFPVSLSLQPLSTSPCPFRFSDIVYLSHDGAMSIWVSTVHTHRCWQTGYAILDLAMLCISLMKELYLFGYQHQTHTHTQMLIKWKLQFDLASLCISLMKELCRTGHQLHTHTQMLIGWIFHLDLAMLCISLMKELYLFGYQRQTHTHTDVD